MRLTPPPSAKPSPGPTCALCPSRPWSSKASWRCTVPAATLRFTLRLACTAPKRLSMWRIATAGGAPGGRGDGGVDLVLRRAAVNGAERTLVQCKHWRAQAVGVDVVRELYGVMAARGAAAGIVVTSGRFTEEATSFAQGRNLRLIDGKQLRRLMQPPANSANSAIPAATSQTDQQHAPPACPACGKPMVQRIARRGAQARRAFWGCSAYPGCRGTRSVSPGP